MPEPQARPAPGRPATSCRRSTTLRWLPRAAGLLLAAAREQGDTRWVTFLEPIPDRLRDDELRALRSTAMRARAAYGPKDSVRDVVPPTSRSRSSWRSIVCSASSPASSTEPAMKRPVRSRCRSRPKRCSSQRSSMLDLSQKNGTRIAASTSAAGEAVQMPSRSHRGRFRRRSGGAPRVDAGLDKLGAGGRVGERREVRPEIADAPTDLVRASPSPIPSAASQPEPGRTMPPQGSRLRRDPGDCHPEHGQENRLQDDPAFATRTRAGTRVMAGIVALRHAAGRGRPSSSGSNASSRNGDGTSGSYRRVNVRRARPRHVGEPAFLLECPRRVGGVLHGPRAREAAVLHPDDDDVVELEALVAWAVARLRTASSRRSAASRVGFADGPARAAASGSGLPSRGGSAAPRRGPSGRHPVPRSGAGRP